MTATDPQSLGLYGEPRPPREPTTVQAGPIRFVFEDGMIKHVRVGEVELVRRVYFGVRDGEWDTIYPEFHNVNIACDEQLLRITFDAKCKSDTVDYTWHGTIEARPDGTLTFLGEGEPHTDFLSNRLGLCLLLPADTLAGRAFQLLKSDDTEVDGRFSRYLDHDLVGAQFHAIRYQPPGGPRVECRIADALFDMEDQRLYMDTTYKAYAPLPHDYPKITAGERRAQTFTLSLLDAPEDPAPKKVARESQPFPDPVTITVDAEQVGHVPLLGLTLHAADGEYALTEAECHALADVKLNHLRLVLDMADPTSATQRVQAAAPTLLAVSDRVMLSISGLTDANLDHLPDLMKPLINAGARRIMIEACDASPDILPELKLMAVTAGIKIDLRYGGPGSVAVSSHPQLRAWALAEPGFVCWAGSPAIHQEDDETLMENTRGIAMQLDTARHLQAEVPAAMGPFTLDGAWPRPRPTPRYTGRLAAAWLATSVKHLAGGGAAFATLFDATGPAGVFYRPADFPQPGFDGGESRPYPSGLVLGWLSGQRGRAVRRTRSSAPLGVQALAVEESDEATPTLLLINQTHQPQAVRIEGLSETLRTIPFTTDADRMHRAVPGLAAGEIDPAPGHEPVAIAPYGMVWLRPAALE